MTPRLHGKVCSWVEENLASGKPRMLILLPRGTFKSSLITIAGSIWFLIRDLETRILLVQQSGKKAEQTMTAISGRLLSEQFRHFFPELIPAKERRDRWNQSDIVINRKESPPEASVSARGIDSRIVGGHYPVIILDDPIDLKEAESETEMDGAIQFVDHLEPFIEPPDRGIVIGVGTRWGNGDLYEHMIESGGYELMESGIITDSRSTKWGFSETSDPIFPERYSKGTIAKIRSRMSDFAFACQYMNKPFAEGVQRFPKSSIRYYNWADPDNIIQLGEERIAVKSLTVCMTVDPSMGKSKKSDESAITVSGIDQRARIFILEAWSARISPEILIRKIFEMQEKWKPVHLGIETVSAQYTIVPWSIQEMRKSGQHFHIEELEPGGHKKEFRIDGMSAFFTNKQVYIQPAMGKLERQLLDFPSSGRDDLIDSLAYHIRWWRPARVDDDPDAIEKAEEEDYVPRAYGLECARI